MARKRKTHTVGSRHHVARASEKGKDVSKNLLFTLEPVAAWVTRWEMEGESEELVLRGNGRLQPAEVFRRPNPLVISAEDILKAAQYVMGGNLPETFLRGADRRYVDWTVDFTSPNSVRIVSRYPYEQVRKTGIVDTGGGKRPVVHAEWLIRQVEHPVVVKVS